MVMKIVFSLLTVFLTAALLYLKWSFRYWKSRNVYTPEPTVPFGNIQTIVQGMEHIGGLVAKIYQQAKAKKQPYAGVYLVSNPAFIPIDNTLLRHILINDFQYFTDHIQFSNDKHDPMSANLFALNGAKWRALRTKLTPLFSSGKLKMLFQTFVDVTNGFPHVLDEAIKQNKPLDIKDTFGRYTIDVIGSVAFGIDCNCLKNPNTEFRMYGKKIFETGLLQTFVRLLSNVSPKLFTLLRLKFFSSDVEKFFSNIVNETINDREKNNYTRNDFMQQLMSLRNQELKVDTSIGSDDLQKEVVFYQNGLSLVEITAQAFVFFGAGYETSSTTLNFLMYELVLNMDIQEKLRKEIETVLKAHNGKITYEGIQEMTYMDKCVNETLRKYPPLPMIPRVCTKDYKVPNSNLVIEKETSVMIPVYGIHHDPEFYPDPEKFDPERFSEENKKNRPTVTFLPFGEGPRLCIGLRMGVLQTKVGLTALLKDYKFTLNSKTELPLEFVSGQIILIVKGGVWVDAHKL